jgi:hypothetical protein
MKERCGLELQTKFFPFQKLPKTECGLDSRIYGIFDKLNNSYAKYYGPTKQLAVNETIMSFKGRVIFKQYIPKKHKQFSTTSCVILEDILIMTVYSGKDRKCETPSLTSTQTTVTGLAARNEQVRHKLYMDNFFLSRALFDDLHTKKINCCGTVRPNRKGTLKNFRHKMKLKRGDPKLTMKSNFTVIIWKEK